MSAIDAPISGSVVLVHGILSSGEWYPHATAALSPHFVVRYADYEGYRGKVEGILNLARFGRGVLRRATLKVRSAFGEARAHEPIHILAHSWGTFLSARVLRSERHDRFGRVILVGTPLSRTFRWKRKNLRWRVSGIDNIVLDEDEIMGPLHWVTSVRLVGPLLATLFVSGDVGGAGARAFQAVKGDLDPGEVHTHSPQGPDPEHWRCAECVSSSAWLHNWTLVSSHSELLQRWDRLALVIRPLLWGLRPADYAEWIKDCGALGDWFLRAKTAGGTGDLPELLVKGYGSPRARNIAFQAALEKLLRTKRSFWRKESGERLSLYELLVPLANRFSRSRKAPDKFVQLWGLRIAEKTLLARVEDSKAWTQMKKELVAGMWARPDPASEPDPFDRRFPLHPSRAFETVELSVIAELGKK